ncbi:ABC transporter substrate-binding protein (plasmid) [Sinorhizobium garamanticum]|uniref:ABC transporter substrate-binding protein n=1 Tax=Sinorhizobium garamanticum TaxID=680247 RepID=A0ABY8DLD4_9HYPH|nr:ABC transporter substrate-binding protein [Sinorhizobium garamanticum]WEX91709.1 ABC transporter substrate-binding protein [Sinorhizobium garamanticum]
MKLRIAAVLAALLTSLSSVSAEELTIRLGHPGTGLDNRQYSHGDATSYARARELIEREFASDKDIKVEWTYFRGAGPALNESVAAEQLDFFLLGDLPAIVGRSRGLEHKFLFATSRHEPIYLAVPANSDIKSIDDVKGRKVALFKGTNLQLATDHVLSTHGLTEKDVRFINLDTSAAVAALASGNVDAVFGGPEFLALANKGIVKIAYTTKGDDPTLGRNSSYLVTAAFEQAHPDLTQRVVTTFVKAAAFASDPSNKDEVFDGWSLSGFPKDVFETDLEGDTLANRLNPLIDDFVVARYKDKVARAKTYGLIKGDVDVDGWLEPKYLRQALKELKLENHWSSLTANGEVARRGDLDKKQTN